jgi:TRAP-type transport system periplasmic protein
MALALVATGCGDGDDTTDDVDEVTDDADDPDDADDADDADDDAADEAADDEADDAANGDNPSVTLDIAHAQEPDHPYQTCGLEVMQEYLEGEPEANLEIEIFGGAQLGSNEETMESVQAGTLAGTVPGLGSLTIYDMEIGALETAFAFEDFEHLQEVVDGEIGQELLEPLRDEVNTRILGPLWKLGSRHITANEPILSPDDLAGKTMRSQDTPASLATAESLGATPTPVDFGELYLALSQGVVDTQENPLVQINSIDLQEVQDYVMMTGHVINASVVLVAENIYQDLTQEQQDVLSDAAEFAADEVLTCIDEGEEEILEGWAAEDPPPIEVVEEDEIDMDAFAANAEEVYTQDDEYGPLWGDLYLEIRDTQ